MNQLRTPLRRRVAAAVATAGLAVGGLAAVAAPAQAAQTGQIESGTVVWGLSTYLNTTAMGSISPLASGYVTPASYDPTSKLSTFEVESVVTDATGSVITLDGASLNYAPTGNRWLKLDDLVIDVDTAGNGELSALVSYGPGVGSYPSSSYDPTVAAYRGPTRVDIVDLVGNSAAENTVTQDVSTWPALDGTWSEALITFLAGDAAASPAVPGLSYRSQLVNTDPAKAPQPLAVTADRAVASTTTSIGAATDAGLPINVSGNGFKQTFPGVYVSLRETTTGAAPYAGGTVEGGAPTVWVSEKESDVNPSDPETGASTYIAEDGSFSTALVLDDAALAALDRSKTYSVVTRKAHGMGQIPSNADQITETPLDVSALKKDSTVAATVAESRPGQPASVAVKVTGAEGTPTGTVTVTNGGAVVGTATLAGGVATVPVSGLPVGATALGVAYAGSAAHWPSVSTATATVAKLTSTLKASWKKKPTSKRAGKLSVELTGPAAAAVPAGQVTVVLTKGGKTKSVTKALVNGKVVLPVTKLKAGTWKATVSYVGEGGYADASDKVTVKVKKVTKKNKKK